jgi:hypothetical protein
MIAMLYFVKLGTEVAGTKWNLEFPLSLPVTAFIFGPSLTKDRDGALKSF